MAKFVVRPTYLVESGVEDVVTLKFRGETALVAELLGWLAKDGRLTVAEATEEERAIGDAFRFPSPWYRV